MTRRRSDAEEQRENLAIATGKVRTWRTRSDKARQQGRKADAERCDDKVRDWASRVRQMERRDDSSK